MANDKIIIRGAKANNLKYWNTTKQQFELEKGQVEIQVGSASDKILLTKKITIK